MGNTAGRDGEALHQGGSHLTYAGLVVGLGQEASVVILAGWPRSWILLTHACGDHPDWPSSISAIGIYLIQNLLHFLCRREAARPPSQWPILAPLGDSWHYEQTNVLAYQLGTD